MHPPTDKNAPTPASAPATPSRRRFRLERLEERIAPAGHTNGHTKWVGGGGSGSSASGSSYPGSYY